MSVPISGVDVTGSGVVYTSPLSEAYVLELLSFTVSTDGTAGVHTVLVELIDRSVGVVFSTLDRNAAGPGQVNRYTFALGGIPSSCTVPGGWAITNQLPWTTLAPEASVQLSAVDDVGAAIGGDVFSDVNMMATFVQPDTGTGPLDPAPGPTMFVPSGASG